MRSRVLTLVMTSIVVIGLASCSKKSSPPTNPTPPGDNGNNNTNVTVNIPRGDGYGVTVFSPTTINVAMGGTVTWNNADTEAHTSTSTTNIWTGSIAAGSSFSRRFDVRGAFPYRCTIHPGMTGEINVQ